MHAAVAPASVLPELDESHRLGFRVSDAWVFLGGKCAPATVSRSYWLSKRCSHRAPRDFTPNWCVLEIPLFSRFQAFCEVGHHSPANFGVRLRLPKSCSRHIKAVQRQLFVGCQLSRFAFRVPGMVWEDVYLKVRST